MESYLYYYRVMELGGLVGMALDVVQVVVDHVLHILDLHQAPFLGYHCIACLIADTYCM